MKPKTPLNLGVSVVLYKTPMSVIAPLLAELQSGGAAKIFVVDNSPPGFDDSADRYQSEIVDRFCSAAIWVMEELTT